ncbi:MAG: hypothetical protein K8S87_00070 [Planctomycetes bacterium]|nr:hypothetical protein [Planctomycetota bacterium]
MTADTSNNDSNRNSDAKNVLEQSNKPLVAIILVIIFVAIALNKVGILNFSSGTHDIDESTEKIQTNENPANTDEKTATTDNEKSDNFPITTETLYDRYTKKPMRYYKYDPISLPSECRIEVFSKFRTWLLGKLPPGIDDYTAECKVDRLSRAKDKLIVYNSPNLPENPAIPENWMLTNDNDKNCVLFVIIPPSKSPLPPEYWIKFIVHENNVGKIYNFGLRQSVKRGFIWTYYGISFE